MSKSDELLFRNAEHGAQDSDIMRCGDIVHRLALSIPRNLKLLAKVREQLPRWLLKKCLSIEMRINPYYFSDPIKSLAITMRWMWEVPS